MANVYTVNFPQAAGKTFTAIRINGVTQNLPTPVDVSDTNTNAARELQDAINALGFDFIVAVVTDTINDIIYIQSIPTNLVLNFITTVVSATPTNTNFNGAGPVTAEDFICPAFTPITAEIAVVTADLTIDCTSESCLLKFKDTTGEYSVSNPTGYGDPNYPEVSEFLSSTFLLWDEAGTTLLASYNSTYVPNSGGTAVVCIDDFGFEVTPGTNYIVSYIGNLPGNYMLCLSIPFTYPCCGAAVQSNLGIEFYIEEKIGCSSFDFTDTTGEYNGSLNPGGYGTPNPDYSDITETSIVVTKPDGSVVEITDFIPTEANPTKNISAYRLGYNDGYLEDGVYTITYSVYKEGKCRIGYKTAMVLFSCRTLSCIQQKALQLLKLDCSGKCRDDEAQTNHILSLIFQYEAIVLAASQNIECVVGDMEKLYRKCIVDCPTCNQ